jgi:hypothetical protein
MIQHNMVYLEHSNKTIPIGSSYREAFMARMKDKIIN